ncbi:MAG: tautomerase family protein [Rhodospirillaceae bacterium]|jgi:4-oxalocrotonate tautomerase|nr:tautomerase family protein [Rhodospirillaceae bacterium]MBT5562997.1 tautomerase family protein [Rhodospirillaceae bacterium]MBT6242667.1 tautomerase family protein [Rhodospirillaceae bacterium]MBT7137402.1 tautomerase family protein [Rhodospirillaceae bacterium]
MPFVRIAHPIGKPRPYSAAISQGVHRAMVETIDVPEDDLFQIVTEHTPETGLIGPDSFLGIEHTTEMVFVQITFSEGRSTDQKKALFAKIARYICDDTDIRGEDIFINVIETKRENWSFGNGLAQFA